MELYIHRDQQLKRLQAQFRSAYPYLRLAFYARREEVRAGSFRRNELPGHLRLSDLRPHGPEGRLQIPPHMRTGELEQMLTEVYRLPAQVFRRSYGRWMPTWATDAWSLRQQNHFGRIMGERGMRLGTFSSSPIQSVRP
jgi:hypothetical protein